MNTIKTDLAVVILAAGKGTRMLSKKQKILHEVGGRPMVMHVVEASRSVAQHPPTLVIGEMGGEALKALVGPEAVFVVQAEQLGTGHAAMMAAKALRGRSAQVLVTYGDMPLLKAETMAALAQQQAQSGAAIVMVTIMGEPSSPFGRIVRDENGRVLEIVEVAEARQRPNTEELLNISELNVGVYCFDGPWLWEQLPHLPLRQARNGVEYYLTDLVAAAVDQGRAVEAIVTDDQDECVGAGTRSELVEVERAFRRRANQRWLTAGVTLVDPDQTFIDQSVIIGQDTIIWPGSYLQGNTVIGEDCVIGPHATIRNSRLGHRVRVEHAVVEDQVLEDDVMVRPFSHLTNEK
ncbi:MAG: NTP transferase domain-containing protein [Ardenticatenaceae bacterium]|nr:NTP transferase domain-containing protein [Ardenticatenaceae bacterium]